MTDLDPSLWESRYDNPMDDPDLKMRLCPYCGTSGFGETFLDDGRRVRKCHRDHVWAESWPPVKPLDHLAVAKEFAGGGSWGRELANTHALIAIADALAAKPIDTLDGFERLADVERAVGLLDPLPKAEADHDDLRIEGTIPRTALMEAIRVLGFSPAQVMSMDIDPGLIQVTTGAFEPSRGLVQTVRYYRIED